MRIASVSDLHTDHAENREAVVDLAAEIHRRGADVVIIAGDISHKNDRIRRAILAFREVADHVAYLPGNHDLWSDLRQASEHSEINTWDRYRRDLRGLAEDAGAHYLPERPLCLSGVAIVGSCGWYDYSMVLPQFRSSLTDEVLKKKQYGRLMWSDARFIAFRDAAGALMDDPAVARVMEADLGAHLDDVGGRASIEHVVVATHHQAYAEVVHRTGQIPWEFFNAFMGSAGLGRVISGCSKVRAAIYGHTHFVAERQIDQIRVFGTPLGYPRERRGLSREALIRSRVGWVELGGASVPGPS